MIKLKIQLLVVAKIGYQQMGLRLNFWTSYQAPCPCCGREEGRSQPSQTLVIWTEMEVVGNSQEAATALGPM